jgi:hypothetical protein
LGLDSYQSKQAETNIYKSTKEFQDALAARVEASASGSAFGFTGSFSASASYSKSSESKQKVMKGVREIRTELWEGMIFCVVLFFPSGTLLIWILPSTTCV